MPRLLFVLTPEFCLAELAGPYWLLSDQGCEIDFASPSGGRVDPAKTAQTQAEQRFYQDSRIIGALASTARPESLEAGDYDGIYLIGGPHWQAEPSLGPLQQLIAGIWEHGGVVAAIAEGLYPLLNLRLSDGSPLIYGRRIVLEPGHAWAAALPPQGARLITGLPGHVEKAGRLLTAWRPAAAWPLAEALAEALSYGDWDLHLI